MNTSYLVFIIIMCLHGLGNCASTNSYNRTFARRGSFVSRSDLNINSIWNVINSLLKLPSWKTPSKPCEHDRDCVPPYACCHDPFFPFSSKFCCLNYKKRTYDPAYILNIIQQ